MDAPGPDQVDQEVTRAAVFDGTLEPVHATGLSRQGGRHGAQARQPFGRGQLGYGRHVGAAQGFELLERLDLGVELGDALLGCGQKLAFGVDHVVAPVVDLGKHGIHGGDLFGPLRDQALQYDVHQDLR